MRVGVSIASQAMHPNTVVKSHGKKSVTARLMNVFTPIFVAYACFMNNYAKKERLEDETLFENQLIFSQAVGRLRMSHRSCFQCW